MKLNFSTAILTLVIVLLTVTTITLLTPAYIGSQRTLEHQFNITYQRDQITLKNVIEEQFKNIQQLGVELTGQDSIKTAITEMNHEQIHQSIRTIMETDRGQRLDAVVLELNNFNSITIKNTSLLDIDIPELSAPTGFFPFATWHSVQSRVNNQLYQFYRVTAPVVNNHLGKVLGKIHIYVLVNDNYWLMNSLQSLFGAKALTVHNNDEQLAALENQPGQIEQLNQALTFTDGIIVEDNNLLREHTITLERSAPITIRMLFPNSASIGLRNSFLSTLGFSLLVVAFLGIITMLILRNLMKWPLQQLIQYAEHIPESGSPLPFPEGRFKEFARVGKAVELMLMRIRERDKRLASILDNSPDLIFIKDLEHRYRLVNKRFAKTLNLPVQNILNHKDKEILEEQSATISANSDQHVLDSRKPIQYEITLANAEGRESIYLMSKFPIFDDSGLPYSVGGIATDITEIKQTQDQLSLSQHVFNETAEAILVLDSELSIVLANKAFSEISGYPVDQIKKISHFLFKNNPEILGVLNSHTSKRWQGEFALPHVDGHKVPVLVSITPLNDYSDASFILLFTDISQLKSAEQRLEQLALYDSLTGLPNRTLFYQCLNETIELKQSNTQSHSAVFFIDLDRFKAINDTYGHNVGDQLLQQVSTRLKQCVKPRDLVCRLGGDEFTLIIQNSISVEKIESIAHRILATLRQPYELDEIRCFTSGSIGIAMIGEDGADSYTLTRHADLAMYQAKESGRNNVQFFDQDINSKNLQRHELEKGLRDALQNDELFLNYQPRYDIEGKRVLSCEALLRWNFADRGLISPEVFIPIAEDSALIVDIGRFVLEQACFDAAQWRNQGIDVPVSVNLSPRQLCDENLLTDLHLALTNNKLPASYLELEITETHVMENIDQVIPILNSIKEMGISLSIDDFGTGYSSLMYLKKLPVSTIKIDRSFIMDIPGNEDDEVLVTAIIRMSHSLRLNVVAEGLETPQQHQFLKQLECNELQGFLLAKPADKQALVAAYQKGEAISH